MEILEVTEDSILFCKDDGKEFFYLKSKHEVEFWEECYLSFEIADKMGIVIAVDEENDIERGM